MRRLVRTALFLSLALFAVPAFAADWTPYELKGPAFFRYVVQLPDMPEVSFSVDIKASDHTDEYGDPLFEVTNTKVSYQTLDTALFGDIATGLMTGFASMYMMLLIPALGDMDMEPGERISLMGMGRVTVVGTAEYAGRTGHHLVLETKDSGDQYVKSMEWVIDFDLPIPLLTRHYEDGELVREERLVEYRAY